MYEYKAGTGDRQFDRLSKQPGDAAKANTALARVPGQAEKAFESPKELKEKLNSPKFTWKIPRDKLCGDILGPWKDAKCTGTDVCVEIKSRKIDEISSEPKDPQGALFGEAAEKKASSPSRAELILRKESAVRVVYRCQEGS